jgi:prephenate dehydrogenase
MVPSTLGVIGLGTVGGSIAWQAARSGVGRILGHDTSTRDGAAAVKAGAITEFTHDAKAVVANSDFVVMAASGDRTQAWIEEVAELLLEGRVYCTDVAGVKRPIVTLAERLGLAPVLAGSHPFVGPEIDGFRSANPELLRGALVYVTPVPGGDQAAAEVRDFWSRTLGANAVALDAEQHDRLLAWTTHLPQTVSSALAAALASEGPVGVTYGESAHEVTRQAGCGLAQWSELLVANRDNVLEALQHFSESVDGLKEALMKGDRKHVETWLAKGATWRARFKP